MLKSSRNTYLLPLAIEPLNLYSMYVILPQISLLFLDTIINEWTILRPALSFLFLRWYLNVNCTFRGFSSSFREFPFNIFKEIGTLLLHHRWKARTFCKVFWLCSELGFLLDFNSGLREGEKKNSWFFECFPRLPQSLRGCSQVEHWEYWIPDPVPSLPESLPAQTVHWHCATPCYTLTPASGMGQAWRMSEISPLQWTNTPNSRLRNDIIHLCTGP